MASNFVIAVLLGYMLVGVAIMVSLRGLRGVMAVIVFGWLFLPPARGVNLPGLPAYTKEFAVSYALLLGILITDPGRLLRYRPSLIDLPLLIWVLAPFPSSMVNGLGAYEGVSSVYFQFMVYGLLYLLGRVYIRTPDDVRVVATWFVIGGLIAVPMIIWESRMSPNLNLEIYGYRAIPFHMAKRLGGYRPMLFMRHGLEVGLWMATCSAVALWLWITTGNRFRIFGYRTPLPASLVILATILCRSLGALILLSGSTAAALFVRATGLRVALIALTLVPSVYLSVRLSNIWSPKQLTAIIRAFDAERADSLESRLNQELVVSSYALEKPVFGWGGQNRFRPMDDQGETHAVDGWTTITLGKYGLVGLLGLLGACAIPCLALLLRIKGREITSSLWAPSIGILLGVSIFSMDILFNAFPTPLHFLGLGVIATVAIKAGHWQRILRTHEQLAETNAAG